LSNREKEYESSFHMVKKNRKSLQMREKESQIFTDERKRIANYEGKKKRKSSQMIYVIKIRMESLT